MKVTSHAVLTSFILILLSGAAKADIAVRSPLYLNEKYVLFGSTFNEVHPGILSNYGQRGKYWSTIAVGPMILKTNTSDNGPGLGYTSVLSKGSAWFRKEYRSVSNGLVLLSNMIQIRFDRDDVTAFSAQYGEPISNWCCNKAVGTVVYTDGRVESLPLKPNQSFPKVVTFTTDHPIRYVQLSQSGWPAIDNIAWGIYRGSPKFIVELGAPIVISANKSDEELTLDELRKNACASSEQLKTLSRWTSSLGSAVQVFDYLIFAKRVIRTSLLYNEPSLKYVFDNLALINTYFSNGGKPTDYYFDATSKLLAMGSRVFAQQCALAGGKSHNEGKASLALTLPLRIPNEPIFDGLATLDNKTYEIGNMALQQAWKTFESRWLAFKAVEEAESVVGTSGARHAELYYAPLTQSYMTDADIAGDQSSSALKELKTIFERQGDAARGGRQRFINLKKILNKPNIKSELVEYFSQLGVPQDATIAAIEDIYSINDLDIPESISLPDIVNGSINAITGTKFKKLLGTKWSPRG